MVPHFIISSSLSSQRNSPVFLVHFDATGKKYEILCLLVEVGGCSINRECFCMCGLPYNEEAAGNCRENGDTKETGRTSHVFFHQRETFGWSGWKLSGGLSVCAERVSERSHTWAACTSGLRSEPSTLPTSGPHMVFIGWKWEGGQPECVCVCVYVHVSVHSPSGAVMDTSSLHLTHFCTPLFVFFLTFLFLPSSSSCPPLAQKISTLNGFWSWANWETAPRVAAAVILSAGILWHSVANRGRRHNVCVNLSHWNTVCVCVNSSKPVQPGKPSLKDGPLRILWSFQIHSSGVSFMLAQQWICQLIWLRRC